MKLLSHNMLTSTCLKGVSVGYPLGINVSIVSINIYYNPIYLCMYNHISKFNFLATLLHI